MTSHKEPIYEQLRANEMPGGCERHGHLYVHKNDSQGHACVYCGKPYPGEAEIGRGME